MIYSPWWWYFHGVGYWLRKYQLACDMAAGIGELAVNELDELIGGE